MSRVTTRSSSRKQAEEALEEEVSHSGLDHHHLGRRNSIGLEAIDGRDDDGGVVVSPLRSMQNLEDVTLTLPATNDDDDVTTAKKKKKQKTKKTPNFSGKKKKTDDDDDVSRGEGSALLRAQRREDDERMPQSTHKRWMDDDRSPIVTRGGGMRTDDENNNKKSSSSVLGAAATAAVFFQAQASPALASAAENAVPSALAAYGHYLGLFLIVGALATEKAVLKPNMSGDELMKLVIADSVYGLAGVLVLYTGYLRVTQYGKGWEFYSHEPIFWFKMFLFAVMGSSSLFVTIKTITTFAAKQKSTDENETYISEKLATRMGKVLNGELLAVLAIPLAATTMSRGILFQQEMDWRLGAVPVALASAGLGFKYVKEAVTWSED